jgi:hypothetical protein
MKEVEAWKVEWYECRADGEDVAADPKKKVGDILWRVARGIGPFGPEHDHWSGWNLGGTEEDIAVAAQAPRMLEALRRILNADNGQSKADALAYADAVYLDATRLKA